MKNKAFEATDRKKENALTRTHKRIVDKDMLPYTFLYECALHCILQWRKKRKGKKKIKRKKEKKNRSIHKTVEDKLHCN